MYLATGMVSLELVHRKSCFDLFSVFSMQILAFSDKNGYICRGILVCPLYLEQGMSRHDGYTI